jgi:hypothetical protein
MTNLFMAAFFTQQFVHRQVRLRVKNARYRIFFSLSLLLKMFVDWLLDAEWNKTGIRIRVEHRR